MTRLLWKHRLHMFFDGNLIGREYHAEEGYVTQCLEMGQAKAAIDFDRCISDVVLRF
ncbi:MULTISPECIES: hypothetical protein [Brevibacillus]|jgi:hypothetical protein|uniref:hypothetical protein n=1 Tax=Brevibacillus TaxID=55080 RepID=UPI000AB3DAE1|nr:hypothetical protein [Brevibacillus borstelensis]MBE5396182.1 hypothetical protein [Brevibacillus borstelensis]MCC0563088.1 hypothetical protein [Brevibacillus borstelensis]MCM3469031.1 hypothetical protein [Brevibacillus borstelensis]MCM3558485.1 hypothetical protein [Brevibacillus borstelensis]MCM3591395.1 hypothetical protein [Brevibacillus borstelensis]